MRSSYVLQADIERIVDSLSDRDRAVLGDLARVRALTGGQLTRLRFADLAPGSGDRTRRRVMARLVELQLAATLERTIGGVRAGSAGHVYSLGIAGQRALPLLGVDAYTDAPTDRVRSPMTPGTRFLAHTLAIAETYVQLIEAERAGSLVLGAFAAEPATWHPDSRGGLLKPDAYIRAQRADLEDYYWLEVDRATESIPTLRRKLLTYVEFARGGGVGPDGIMPRVLVTVPQERRLAAVQEIIAGLPTPAGDLLIGSLHDLASRLVIDTLCA